MNSRSRPLSLAALLAALLVAPWHPAQASTYRSANNSTVLVIDEVRRSSAISRGVYGTRMQGREWSGSIEINQEGVGVGSITYFGTVQDFALGPGPAMRLKPFGTSPGERVVLRQGKRYRSRLWNPCRVPIAWATSMPQIPIPSAAKPVVMAPGLHGGSCPRLQKLFMSRQRIEPELRGVNAFVIANGSPWLLTTNRYYVRANARYLEPVSIPN